MKKIVILTIALFFAFTAFAKANSMGAQVENWLQKSGPSNTSAIGDGQEPTTDSTIGATPIGEGLLILSLLSTGYAFVNKKRNSRKSNKSQII